MHKISKQLKTKCCGFTLAEILITLGIIGVVAAMTIPNLIAEHQKRATVTKLQHAMSVLNQAYRRAYDDVGEATAEEARTMGIDAYFDKYWAPYLKIAHICKTYKDCGYKSNNPFYYLDNTHCTTNLIYKNTRTVVQTMDGFTYIILTMGGAPLVKSRQIFVDINSGAKPNRVGKDTFLFIRAEDGEKGGIVIPYGYDKTDEEINAGCKKGEDAFYCAEKIRRAGWQIDKSYPW